MLLTYVGGRLVTNTLLTLKALDLPHTSKDSIKLHDCERKSREICCQSYLSLRTIKTNALITRSTFE